MQSNDTHTSCDIHQNFKHLDGQIEIVNRGHNFSRDIHQNIKHLDGPRLNHISYLF